MASRTVALFAILVLGMLPRTLAAGEVLSAAVNKAGGVYHLDLDARIDAPLEQVYPIVTDYGELSRLSRIVLESRLLEPAPAGRLRLWLSLRSCLLLFCFKFQVVSELQESDHTVLASVIPELSDFKSGRTTWRFQSQGRDACRVHLAGEMEPGFWIPPVIGALIIRYKVMREAGRIIAALEAQTRDA